MGNLLENAISHTPAGGKVELSARQENGHLCLRVRDTGRGIPPEHLPFVLDRFYRVDGARSRGANSGGNSGLGLAIVKSIATLHRGQVEVNSQVGFGTTVTLVLPSYGGVSEPAAC
jgi:signal transduction histidine kinase